MRHPDLLVVAWTWSTDAGHEMKADKELNLCCPSTSSSRFGLPIGDRGSPGGSRRLREKPGEASPKQWLDRPLNPWIALCLRTTPEGWNDAVRACHAGGGELESRPPRHRSPPPEES
jgi:hypothetical protein